MKELYSWVPWFQELARNIAAGGKEYLLDRSKSVAWHAEDSNDRELGLHSYGPENVDPLSFIYTLASRSKHYESRKRIYQSVASVFEIGEEFNFDCEDAFYFPTPPAVNTLFHQNGAGNPELMWNIFRSAVQGIKHISPNDFETSLTVGRVKTQKMTQVLFLINPKEFLPIDKRTEALNLFDYVDPISWENYLDYIQKIRHHFSICELYEVNLFAYFLSSKKMSVNETCFQIATNNFDGGRDKFDIFTSENCVFTRKHYDSLRSPVKGDIILARHSGQGRGIGIVYRNDYLNSGVHEDGRIHVIWLNKLENNGLGGPDWHSTYGFGMAKYIRKYFQEAQEYQLTFSMLNGLTQGSTENRNRTINGNAREKRQFDERYSLNLILYGPPGTGKTFSTTRMCIEICDESIDVEDRVALRNRFQELRDVERRIEFVTFHQSYGYEEFVEGLRPDTSSEMAAGNTITGEEEVNQSSVASSGFRLKAESGVLRRIADRAREDAKNSYVLIIDEINRANISKVLGELVTLLEEDKREGAENEVSVTLPYSGEAFTLPRNLYILGTMNTADRSIALLDTALRRRFEFVEMPPKPELLKTVGGVNLSAVLSAINNRLEYLIDRDHLIGHAWLMNCKSLDDVNSVMRNKIIPLIAEYFYDDWNNVCAVLGGDSQFVTRKKLDCPPGLEEDSGEDRYRWTVNEPPYTPQAYSNLISPTAKQETEE